MPQQEHFPPVTGEDIQILLNSFLLLLDDEKNDVNYLTEEKLALLSHLEEHTSHLALLFSELQHKSNGALNAQLDRKVARTMLDNARSVFSVAQNLLEEAKTLFEESRGYLKQLKLLLPQLTKPEATHVNPPVEETPQDRGNVHS